MRGLRRGARAVRVVIHIGTGFVVAFGTGAFFSSRPRPLVRAATQWWLGKLARILDVETVVTGTPAAQPALFVANHVSWLDIPVLGGLSRLHFLSKAEVGDWPLIGRLATAAGTLYIRRGHGQVRERARQIADHIGAGRSILVFPEGTTTDGRDVRDFHAPLFAAATAGGHPVQPVAIRYRDRRGEPCRLTPFIGDDEFTGHLWRLLGADGLRVEVHFLPPLPAAGDHRELAVAARQAVRARVTAADR
ncbi:MAG: lysophospholipid acyltransferase family protein [Pseudomonadota bacterium]